VTTDTRNDFRAKVLAVDKRQFELEKLAKGNQSLFLQKIVS